MDLLPKTSEQFATKQYWDTFFKKRTSDGAGGSPFEWYAEYNQLASLLNKYVTLKDDILVVGCGNSSLSADLVDSGHQSVTSIDISNLVIEHMQKKYLTPERLKMVKTFRFLTMDATQMKEFENDQFNVAIDKGTLDAIIVDSSDKTKDTVHKILSEVERVVRPCGRFICVSLLQDHVLKMIIEWFMKQDHGAWSWMIRIHRCFEAEIQAAVVNAESDNADSLVLPVFVLVCTKLKKMGNLGSALVELALTKDPKSKPKRAGSIEDVINSIKPLQEFAFMQSRIKKQHSFEEEQVKIDLHSPQDDQNPRYTICVVSYVSRIKNLNLKYAVFIVPQGRETEWLFGSDEGRLELAKQIKCARLLVVHLNRNHVYRDMDQIKEELSNAVVDLTPSWLLKEIMTNQVPFLTTDSTGQVGQRKVQFRGISQMTGPFVVEDVLVSGNGLSDQGQWFRRLVFLSSQNIIQSEARLKMAKKRLVIDHSILTCDHHMAIVSGLVVFMLQERLKHQLLKPQDPMKILLVGLGGGCLASFIQNSFRDTIASAVHLDVVEIDREMLNVAQKWFGLKDESGESANKNQSRTAKLQVHIADGIKYIYESKENYDAVILDVDSKSQDKGISCPPEAFLEPDFLKKIGQMISERKGLLLLNLVARSTKSKEQVYATLKSVFQYSFAYKIPEEVNEIIFLSNDTLIDDPNSYAARTSAVEQSIKKLFKDQVIKSIAASAKELLESSKPL